MKILKKFDCFFMKMPSNNFRIFVKQFPLIKSAAVKII